MKTSIITGGEEYGCDERGRVLCKCGCGRAYPSKHMLLKFLEKEHADTPGKAKIWSEHHICTGEVIIHPEIRYGVNTD